MLLSDTATLLEAPFLSTVPKLTQFRYEWLKTKLSVNVT